MLLDKLLSNLAVQVEPFALCILSAGRKLPLPGSPAVVLHYVLKGRGEMRGPRGEVYSLGPSWLGVVPSGMAHTLESRAKKPALRPAGGLLEGTPTVRRIVVGSTQNPELIIACGAIRVHYGDSLNLFDHLREILVLDLSEVPQVPAAFQGILLEQSNPGPGSEAMTTALMSQCLVHLLRHLATGSDCPMPWLMALEDPRLARAIDKILGSPAAHHTVDSLALEASMSRSAFAERFTAAFGRPPMTLVHNVRMQRAAQLLQQGSLSIDQVAGRVGFSSRSHFSQAFKRHTGTSPASFRAAH